MTDKPFEDMAKYVCFAKKTLDEGRAKLALDAMIKATEIMDEHGIYIDGKEREDFFGLKADTYRMAILRQVRLLTDAYEGIYYTAGITDQQAKGREDFILYWEHNTLCNLVEEAKELICIPDQVITLTQAFDFEYGKKRMDRNSEMSAKDLEKIALTGEPVNHFKAMFFANISLEKEYWYDWADEKLNKFYSHLDEPAYPDSGKYPDIGESPYPENM